MRQAREKQWCVRRGTGLALCCDFPDLVRSARDPDARPGTSRVKPPELRALRRVLPRAPARPRASRVLVLVVRAARVQGEQRLPQVDAVAAPPPRARREHAARHGFARQLSRAP
jgi:hypothetical protein